MHLKTNTMSKDKTEEEIIHMAKTQIEYDLYVGQDSKDLAGEYVGHWVQGYQYAQEKPKELRIKE